MVVSIVPENKYRWKIEIVLNCGKQCTGIYEGEENNSVDVGKKILCGDTNSFNAIQAEENGKHLFIKVGDISAAYISTM